MEDGLKVWETILEIRVWPQMWAVRKKEERLDTEEKHRIGLVSKLHMLKTHWGFCFGKRN
jgi:hypothetical protein